MNTNFDVMHDDFFVLVDRFGGFETCVQFYKLVQNLTCNTFEFPTP